MFSTKDSAIVYVADGCTVCHLVKEKLYDDGFHVEERDAMEWEAIDSDLEQRLIEKDGLLPQVVIDGRWVEPSQIIAGAYG